MSRILIRDFVKLGVAIVLHPSVCPSVRPSVHLAVYCTSVCPSYATQYLIGRCSDQLLTNKAFVFYG